MNSVLVNLSSIFILLQRDRIRRQFQFPHMISCFTNIMYFTKHLIVVHCVTSDFISREKRNPGVRRSCVSKLPPQKASTHTNNEVALYLYCWRQDGQPFAIHPLYCLTLVHANMSSSPSGKVCAVSLTSWHPPCWREGLLEHKREGAFGEGLGSMTVLDTLIDPAEKGAITRN